MSKLSNNQVGFLVTATSFIVIAVFVTVANRVNPPPKPTPIKYRFTAITSPDGTPCYVVRGGSHAGMVGVTCNYAGEFE